MSTHPMSASSARHAAPGVRTALREQVRAVGLVLRARCSPS